MCGIDFKSPISRLLTHARTQPQMTSNLGHSKAATSSGSIEEPPPRGFQIHDLKLLQVTANMDDESFVPVLAFEACNERRLPFPKPSFDLSSPPPSLLSIDQVLSRARSQSPKRAEGVRELFRTRNMTQSLPSFHTSRSLHNRGVGVLLSDSSECGDGKGKNLIHTRAQEFEQLLEGL